MGKTKNVDIILRNRYGTKVLLRPTLTDKTYQFIVEGKDCSYLRLGTLETENEFWMIDPPGGPFLRVGCKTPTDPQMEIVRIWSEKSEEGDCKYFIEVK